MRKLLTISTLLLCLMAQLAHAVVASPEKFRYTQPDGTVITLQLHGDEHCHWTTMDGVPVVKGDDGFYRPESVSALQARRAAARISASDILNRDKVQPAVATSGKKPFLVILVEFQDLPFTVPNARQAFSNLLNQTGYQANGATGSIHDYFYDNSRGVFDPQFDVYGPIKVSKDFGYYGGPSATAKDSYVTEAFNEACRLLDPQVDFSRYDTDSDGYVDNVFFYFAGHNEAEGGGEKTIWPHASSMSYNYNCVCDGVRVYRFACSSEYRGSSGTEMCGIGTFCHEFAHVLGLPDFYDTDYETNGSAKDLGPYSLMCDGNYNNRGRTPPYLNSVERNILGWMDDPVEWTTAGNKTVAPIQDNIAYFTPTTTDREWFIYETRNGTGWDQYIGKGLLIYHVDRSSTHFIGGMSASQHWATRNKINAYADHPCFYVVQAGLGTGNYPFGGASFVTSFADMTTPGSIDWDGYSTGYNLTNINFGEYATTLTLSIEHHRAIKGIIVTDKGKALPDVRVTLVPKPSHALRVSRTSAGDRVYELRVSELAQASGLTVYTDKDGHFSQEITSGDTEFYVVASKDGYITQSEELSLVKGSRTIQFVMPEIFTMETASLSKHNGNIGTYVGINNKSAMGAVLFTQAELRGFVGSQIEKLNFRFQGGGAAAVYAIIDFGSERVLTHKLENPQYNGALNTIDISSYGLAIPAGRDVYFGYAVEGGASNFPLIVGSNEPVAGGMYYSSFNLRSSSWHEYTEYNIMVSADVRTPFRSLATLGYNLIRNEKNSYSAGDVFTFALEETAVRYKEVHWYFDDKPADAAQVILDSGTHTVKAVIDHFDGTTEILFLTLNVD